MSDRTSENELLAAEQTFRRYLRHHGLKFTPERRRVLREVLSSREHFEADGLLTALRQTGQRVAKATIYRTLPLLVDCGILRQLRLDDKAARYERSLGQIPHDHMVCLSCRRIIEFDSRSLIRLRRTIAARNGFQDLSHRFQISGICAECAGEEKARPAKDQAATAAPAEASAARAARRRTATPRVGRPRSSALSKGPRRSAGSTR